MLCVTTTCYVSTIEVLDQISKAIISEGSLIDYVIGSCYILIRTK